MKKLILSTAIVLGGLTAVTAQTEKDATALSEKSRTAVEAKVESRMIVAQEAPSATKAVQDYKEVKTSEIPQAVKDAIADNFNEATISKAYVNAQGDFKIDLATADAKKATAYINPKGELVKNELKKQ